MTLRTQKAEGRRQKLWAALLLLLSVLGCGVWADDLPALLRDRTAIEQVYYTHRLGEKPPFEEVSPPALIQRLVQDDMRKEAALKRNYRVEITPALLEAEVKRINRTTRAPETLAEIKAALGNDPAQFANVFAKPILVERLLRDKFENDDALHAATRRTCESVRAGLLAARTNGATTAQLLDQLKRANSNAVAETTWQLTPRPAETNAPAADEQEVRKRFGPNAQLLSSPQRADVKDQKFYFEDLPIELQRVLRAQLRQAGDVSAVIETFSGFLLYLAKEKTATALTVDCLSMSKRSYEQWLAEQDGGVK